MTNKKEAPSHPKALDAPDAEELAAQFRPAWETGENDTITSSAPRPIERITAQARTDEDPTMKPVLMPTQEESGERRIPSLTVHEEPTLRVPALEEVTQIDRTIPTMEAPSEAPSPGRNQAAPPQSGNFVLQGTPRRFDARDLANSDPEMALSPMRPRAITVPTGFVARADGTVEEDRPQKDTRAPRRPFVPTDRAMPPTGDIVLQKNNKPIKVVFGVMGGLVVLIGLGVIVKAAIGATSSASTPSSARAAHTASEPTLTETAHVDLQPTAPKQPRNDIPPPPADDRAAAEPPSTPSATAPPPPNPIAATRAPVSAPARPPVTRPATGGAARPPQNAGKGGIVRETPF